MGTTQHLVILIEALLSRNRTMTEQFGNIVYGLTLLASNQKLQTDDVLKQRLQHLIGVWTGRSDDAVQEVTVEDVADAKALLAVFDQAVSISDPEKVSLRTLRWGDQLRFGTASVLAASYHLGDVAQLFGHEMYDTKLLERVYVHVSKLHSGVIVTDFREVLLTNRAFIGPLVVQLQALLDDPNHSVASLLVEEASSLDVRVLDLRFATVAAIARLALLASKSN